MIVESFITVFGMRVRVSRSRGAAGYTAELHFEGGDRAVIDAASMEELEGLIEAVALPAVVARAQRPGTAGAATSSSSAEAPRLRRAAWS